MGTRRGQAMMELAMGMFAVALVVAMLCTFATYIVKSLRVQNAARSSRSEPAGSVETDGFFAETLGVKSLSIREKAAIPRMRIP